MIDSLLYRYLEGAYHKMNAAIAAAHDLDNKEITDRVMSATAMLEDLLDGARRQSAGEHNSEKGK